MIKVIACTCGGVERLARTTLRNGGMKNALEVPITRGKKESMRELASLPETCKETAQYKALLDYVSKAGRFVIIVGYSDNDMRWMDVSRGTIKEKLDGELIVEHFKAL